MKDKILQFIDSHCHLSFNELGSYGEKSFEILKEGKNQGLDIVIDIATDLNLFSQALSFAEKVNSSDVVPYPKVATSLGIHPLHINANSDFKIEDFNHFVSNKNLVAIGETGLDYYYSKDNLLLQKKLFEIHCQAACNFNLPIIIHSREAALDTIEILSHYVKHENLKGVIHCYSYDKETAKKFLDIGFFLSFSGIVTFKNSTALQEAAIYTPDSKILTETDAPFLAPVPYRGKTNMPFYVRHTVEFLAKIKAIDVSNLTNTIKCNTFNLFDKINV